MRLRGGSSDAEGRVEVCVNSRWGTVCRGRGETLSWDSNEAGVVCQQLGFNITETSEFLSGVNVLSSRQYEFVFFNRPVN